MKIIQVTPYHLPHFGGIESVVKESSDRLSKKNHQVEVLTSNIGTNNGKLKSKKNLKINYLNALELAHTPLIPSLFFKLLKLPKDSIIHIHIAQAFSPEIVYLASKIKKIPYVAQVHTDIGHSSKLGFLLPLYKKLFLKRDLKNADKVICLSESYKKLLIKKYALEKNKLTVIPNGVKEEFFIKAKKKSNKINLLYVGRLSSEKNISKLLEAVFLLKNTVTLDIVGDGTLRNELKEKTKKLKLKNVIFHGRKSGKDLLELYKKANIFLLASDFEGQPLVLLEAMATGTPIIASDVKGIRELVKGIGILVNPPTPKNFAKKIGDLISDQNKIKELSKKGREKSKKYSWDKIIKQTENIYKEVLEKNGTNKK